ncbi:MAG: threonylcarbamoyl-AMP synthase [Spirochaetes bacterium]|nr:threonylcarbamoyl-AMP synthase [Spirochaetota bacterium]
MSKKIIIQNQQYNCIKEIVQTLLSGGIVIMPSDTIYGFLFTQKNEQKVRDIKKRDKKPFLYLIDDLSRLKALDIDLKPYQDILLKNWPGPFTFILEDQQKKTVGVRWPDWSVLQDIIAQCNQPLLSTSINLSGQPALNQPEKIEQYFGRQVDLMVFDTAFKASGASTIVQVNDQNYHVIRTGDQELVC